MVYDLAKINMSALMRPAFDAGVSLSRLNERIARSPVGQGWLERQNFADACASLWIDGELVHLEDLVLHDATRDIRTPTHELTIARDVLRTRRRIAGQRPTWPLSPEGIRTLRQTAEITSNDVGGAMTAETRRPTVIEREGEGDDAEGSENLLGVDSGRTGGGKAAGVGSHGSEDAGCNAAGGAADRSEAGAWRDDGQGKVSGVSSLLMCTTLDSTSL